MEENVGFISAVWTETVTEVMADATGSNPTYTVSELKAEVEGGAAQLFAVVDRQPGDEALLGYIIFWVEQFGGGRELVLQAGAALLAHTEDTLAYVMPAIRRQAKAHNCGSIRAHVVARGMERKFRRLGWACAERVMRVEV